MAKKSIKAKQRDRMLAGLIILLLLLLGFWWLAMHNHWGAYRIKTTTPTTSAVSKPASGSSAASATGATGATGASGSNGSSSSSTIPNVNTPIFNLYGSVHNGETKADVQASSGGLSPNCVVTATSTSNPGGKQEVCTYTQGDKVVTVTYLNDNVAAVSKSGF